MMKLFIHDKCMEQLFALPKPVQKKVLEFQRKFRENSKSSAINFEAISTFKDQQLRTARIDDKYRAIVKAPETGDNYYLLWVDNHDEAMDWAKNKVFYWNDNTDSAQIFTAPETNIVNQKVHDSIKAPHLFDGFSDEQLLHIGVPSQTLILVRSLKDLNELGDSEKYIPNDAFENLFYITEGLNIELLIAEINEGKSIAEEIEAKANSINNKRNFVEVDDDLMSEIINGDLSKWQIYLHPSQRKLVEPDFKGSVRVTGGAGTGKTVVALHRLKKLTSILIDSDDRKVLFTTFTNALTQNLSLLADKLSIDKTKIIITNIDTLLRDLAKEYNLVDKNVRILDFYNSKSSYDLWDDFLEQNLTEFDTLFLTTEYQNVILFNDIKNLEDYLKVSRIGRGKPISRKIKMEVWELVEKYNHKKKEESYVDRAELFNLVTNHLKSATERPFKNVITDEVQDLSNIELRFLRALVEEKANDLFLVGDPYQKIYTRKINFTAAGISIRGNRSKQLKINYRTSEEIKRLAVTAVKGINYDDFDGETEKLNGYLSLFHGEQPTYEVYKTKSDEINAIINHIAELKEKGFKLNDIALAFRTKEALKEVKTALHKNKIPFTDNAAVGNDNTGIILSTFHGIKGLEFKAVMLCDVNNRTVPLMIQKMDTMEQQEKEDYLNREKSLLYVAMTRAISVLKITGTGIKSELINI
nr:UvrD-helicase domain-containing protein [uncultured Flavobacterium sp.]